MLETVGAWLTARRSGEGGWVLALLIAVGIGLHNFGEGLAIGSAFALGEAALGTLFIVGFTLHNTTEGLAIVAPLARERRSVSRGSWRNWDSLAARRRLPEPGLAGSCIRPSGRFCSWRWESARSRR